MDIGPMGEGDDIMIEVEDCQIDGMTIIEVTIEEEDPMMMENPLMVEDPLMMEDCLMMEDPLEMEEIRDVLEDEDHQAHQDPLDL